VSETCFGSPAGPSRPSSPASSSKCNTMSAVTMLNESEMTSDIQRFFEAFCTAFAEFDGALIAQRYATPYTSLNAEGALQVFGTQEKIAQYFQGFLNKYHEQGFASTLQLIMLKLSSSINRARVNRHEQA